VPISPPVHIVAFSLLKIGYEDGSKITFRRKRLSLEKKKSGVGKLHRIQ